MARRWPITERHHMTTQNPQTDPEFMQRIVNIMQTQRNQALDALAVSEANAAKMAVELSKAQNRITELENVPSVETKQDGA